MKAKTVSILLLTFMFFLPLAIGGQDDDTAMRYDFLCGSYVIVGRWPDSDISYAGTGTISKAENYVTLKKHIGGEVIRGRGEIVEVTSDKVKALRVRFEQGGTPYEATYVMAADLDNYARLSGYLYRENGSTKHPGLEAWFIDRTP